MLIGNDMHAYKPRTTAPQSPLQHAAATLALLALFTLIVMVMAL